MPILIIAFGGATLAHRYLQTYGPSNAIVAKVRRERPRLRLAAGLLVLSAALALGAIGLSDWAANGGPGWLHLIVLVAIWDASKLALLALALVLRRARAALQKGARPQPAPAAS